MDYMSNSPYIRARRLYYICKADPMEEARVRAEYKKLAVEMELDAGKNLQITNATMNGQTFSGTVIRNNNDRLDVLELTVQMLDNKGPISSRVKPTF